MMGTRACIPALAALLLAACGPKGPPPNPALQPEARPDLVGPAALLKAPPPSGGAKAATLESTEGIEAGPTQGAAIQDASPERAALVQALSPHDGAPPCADLGALSPDPATDLIWIASNVTTPPWVGMRAAECLVEGHANAARSTLLSWVTRPELKGFGMLVLGKLDSVDTSLALELATAALSGGPDPAGARRRLLKSAQPELRALAESAPEPR